MKQMVFKWGGKGNYYYAVARVKAKKALLLSKDTYPKLLLMDLNEINRFLGETQYKVEMAELASRYDGVNLIEHGTAKNLARVYRQILGFCSGSLYGTLEKYLARWDNMNMKTVLRGKMAGATVEDVQEDIVIAGKLSEEQILALYSIESIKDILDQMAEKYGIDVPDELRTNLDTTGDLGPIEDYLDKSYYRNFFKELTSPSLNERTLVNLVRLEVDIRNIITLLKLKKYNVQSDKLSFYFIENGKELPVKELIRMAGMESFEGTIGELSKLTFYETIKDTLEAAKTSKSISEVEIALQKYYTRQTEKLSHGYPASVLPIVDYMQRKKIEVDNIRIIARGKQSGLDSEQIKKLLVI